MKKNCQNCKYFHKESACDDPSSEITGGYFYCEKLDDRNEENINLPAYQNRYKRCFESAQL